MLKSEIIQLDENSQKARVRQGVTTIKKCRETIENEQKLGGKILSIKLVEYLALLSKGSMAKTWQEWATAWIGSKPTGKMLQLAHACQHFSEEIYDSTRSGLLTAFVKVVNVEGINVTIGKKLLKDAINSHDLPVATNIIKLFVCDDQGNWRYFNTEKEKDAWVREIRITAAKQLLSQVEVEA
jgi:hypothetical protein